MTDNINPEAKTDRPLAIFFTHSENLGAVSQFLGLQSQIYEFLGALNRVLENYEFLGVFRDLWEPCKGACQDLPLKLQVCPRKIANLFTC